MIAKNLFTCGCVLLLVCASYPLALLGQFATDMLYGDGQIARDLAYGYRRVLAAKLVKGWTGSLIWVAAFWLAIHAARRCLPRLYAPTVLLITVIVLAASTARLLPVPPMFGWLLLASLSLYGVYLLALATLLRDSR